MNQTATQNKCKSTILRKILQIQKITGAQLDILQDKYCTLNVAECLLAANLFAKLLTSIKHCFEIVQAQDNRCLYGIKEDRVMDSITPALR